MDNDSEDFRATDEPGEPVPGHRNYLVYCDESGVNGTRYYGFGSLWMPWERRGDFQALVAGLRREHRYQDEIKWTHVTKRSEKFYLALVEEFFRRTWLMFHCVIVRKGYVDQSFHRDFDEARRKHFALLIRKKVSYFSDGSHDKSYHVRVDPLPSRYKKADEAAFKIIGSTLRKELGLDPVKSLFTRDSKTTPGIQMADMLLGATMAPWQDDVVAEPKLNVRKSVADHLGWQDLRADTYRDEWKFNIWYFYDPTTKAEREVQSRPVRLQCPLPGWRRQAPRSGGR